jgi:hypothetical protein
VKRRSARAGVHDPVDNAGAVQLLRVPPGGVTIGLVAGDCHNKVLAAFAQLLALLDLLVDLCVGAASVDHGSCLTSGLVPAEHGGLLAVQRREGEDRREDLSVCRPKRSD